MTYYFETNMVYGEEEANSDDEAVKRIFKKIQSYLLVGDEILLIYKVVDKKTKVIWENLLGGLE